MDGRAGRSSRAAALVVIGFLSAFAPLATDLYLPAMPALGDAFAAPEELTQATLAACFLGIALGQLVWGPVADRAGRRVPILLGVAAFTIASLVCALSPTIEVFIVARFVQGLAGAAGIVIGRAVLRDWYAGADLSRILARLLLVSGSAPVIAPMLGGALLQLTDWRGTFWALLALGAALLVATWLAVPESLPAERRLRGRAARAGAWIALARHPVFMLFALVQAVAMSTVFTYITFAPHVFVVERGVPDWLFALLFGVNAIGLVAGGQVSAALVRRAGAGRLIVIGLAVDLAASALALACGAFGWPTWLLCVALFVVMAATGLVLPNATALALEPFRSGAGTASAVVGAAQFLAAGTVPLAFGAVLGVTGSAMGVGMIISSVVAIALLAIAWWRRRGEPRTLEPASD